MTTTTTARPAQGAAEAATAALVTEVAAETDTAVSGQPRARGEGRERDVRAPATNKRGRYVETREYVGFCRRAIRALTKRVGQEADVEGLPAMLELQAQLDAAITTAVAGLRDAGYSWDEIADRCGMRRQSAWERWSKRISALKG
jgi:hypothetical protein